ncbi:hypothetical protein VTJ83DRAFT_4120 [Remersonia thermophila]|uniref:Microbial-type PARG catalytic domain-containing protein n=1 Tax=Remersonia thermophila TaxID=72144 RepID=A0ABR4D8Z6_9PEZI
MWRKKYYEHPKRLALAAIAKETVDITPTIAAGLPHLDPTKSEKLHLDWLPPLDATKCPGFKVSEKSDPGNGTRARVFNQDTFDAALAMPAAVLGFSPSPEKSTQEAEAEIFELLKSAATSPSNLNPSTAARVVVLNMASERSPGGGWLKGASAQEEALCYRSTLAASLHRELYPIQRKAGLYTRDVVIFRGSVADGHKLMIPETAIAKLSVVSALSVAGIRRPEVKPANGAEAPGTSQSTQGSPEQARKMNGKKEPKGLFVFADPAALELTKDKMRLCLRMAAAKGHTMLVLGAIGCGAFRNPPNEVVQCWLEVLGESEFAGGWFKEVWFAVLDRRNEGNFEIFKDAFDGKVFCELR